MPRSYEQQCALAMALDVVGGRWSLLVVRELFLGPKRYGELLAGLPGVPTNLLAERLRALEAAGLVRRAGTRPGAGAYYELTERGRELEPVLLALIRWGFPLLLDPPPGAVHHAAWAVLCFRAFFRPEIARGVRETYEFRIGGDTFHAAIDGPTVRAREGQAAHPDLVVTADTPTLQAVVTGELDVEAAIASQRLRISGDRATFKRCMRIFAPPTIGAALAARQRGRGRPNPVKRGSRAGRRVPERSAHVALAASRRSRARAGERGAADRT